MISYERCAIRILKLVLSTRNGPHEAFSSAVPFEICTHVSQNCGSELSIEMIWRRMRPDGSTALPPGGDE
jgi:hypothetical protein